MAVLVLSLGTIYVHDMRGFNAGGGGSSFWPVPTVEGPNSNGYMN